MSKHSRNGSKQYTIWLQMLLAEGELKTLYAYRIGMDLLLHFISFHFIHPQLCFKFIVFVRNYLNVSVNHQGAVTWL